MDEFRKNAKPWSEDAVWIRQTKEEAEELMFYFNAADNGEDLRIAKERLKEAVMWAIRAFTADKKEKSSDEKNPEACQNCGEVHPEIEKDFAEFIKSVMGKK